jgi:hypothetical protein
MVAAKPLHGREQKRIEGQSTCACIAAVDREELRHVLDERNGVSGERVERGTERDSVCVCTCVCVCVCVCVCMCV